MNDISVVAESPYLTMQFEKQIVRDFLKRISAALDNYQASLNCAHLHGNGVSKCKKRTKRKRHSKLMAVKFVSSITMPK